MTQEWKTRQKIYHKLNRDHADDLGKVDIVYDESNIVRDAVRYFNEVNVGWIYPAKSYAVAICYANWLSQDFKEPFFDLLDDKDLLFGNDPYFKRYSEAKQTYIDILNKINLDDEFGMVPDIKYWYKLEFIL